MSSIQTLINSLTKNADPLARLDLHDQIFRAIPTLAYPYSEVSEAFSIPVSIGGTVSITVDSTRWMSPAQRLLVSYTAGGTTYGAYFEVDSVSDVDTTSVTLKLVETVTAVPGDVIPAGSHVLIGVPPGEKTGYISCDIGVGWLKKTDGSWKPASTTATLVATFKDRSDTRQRTVTADLDDSAGTITMNSYAATESGINLTVLNDGSETVTLQFTDVATGIIEQHTLLAIDAVGPAGPTGATGAAGEDGDTLLFYGVWDSSVNYVAGDLKSLILHDGDLYIAKQDNINKEPTGATDSYWEKLSVTFDGYTLNGANGSFLQMLEDYVVRLNGEFSGSAIIKNRSSSLVDAGVVDDDIDYPFFSHGIDGRDSVIVGDSPQERIAVFNPGGGEVWAHKVDSTPTSGDLFNPNLLGDTEAFDGTDWSLINGTITANNGYATDLAFTADKIQGSGEVAVEQEVTYDFVAVPGHWLTLSCHFFGGFDTPELVQNGMLEISEYNSAGTKLTSTKEAFKILKGRWKRHFINHKVSNVNVDSIRVRIGGSVTSGSNSIYLWGSQLELGWKPTPYQEGIGTGGHFSITTSPTTIRAKCSKHDRESNEIRLLVTTSTSITPPVIYPIYPYHEDEELIITIKHTSALGASIKYTTDGTDPSVSGTTYSGPFSITSTGIVTVRAIAIDGSSNESSEILKSFNYKPFE